MHLPIVSNLKVERHLLVLVLYFLIGFVILFGAWQPWGYRHLHVDIEVSKPSVAQLFYATTGSYSEAKSIKKDLKFGRNRLDFKLPFGVISAMRFDPVNNDSATLIRSVRVSTVSRTDMAIPLATIRRGANVRVEAASDGLRVMPTAGSSDPQLLFPVPVGFTHARMGVAFSFWSAVAAVWLIVGLGCVLLGRCLRLRAVVVCGISVATGLILAVATLSPIDHSVSPDEVSHKGAYVYYLDHLLAPAVEDPAVIPSISGYGYSYLMEWDVAYWIAARVTTPLLFVFSDDLYAARAFNVALWFGLLLLAMLGGGVWPWVISVMLLTPQAWYIFAYFNADAFPLFLALVCAGLIAKRECAVGRFLQGGRIDAATVLFMFALGLLLVSKRNFLPLLPAFVLWLAALHLPARAWSLVSVLVGIGLVGTSLQLGSAPSVVAFGGQIIAAIAGFLLALSGGIGILWASWNDMATRKRLWRLVVLVVGVMLVAAPRIGWDLAVNGTPAEKHERTLIVADAHAMQGLRPSDTQPYPTLRMAAHGAPLRDILSGEHHWLRTSVVSAFGVYGNMEFPAPTWTIFGLFLVALLVYGVAIRAVIRTSPDIGIGLCLLLIVSSLLVAVASLLHSWVADYQAQGRYLLPILPLIALAMAHSSSYLSRPAIRTLLLLATLLGIYSFTFTALPALA